MRFFNLKSNTLLIYIEMNKTLPIELINLIFSYVSSPVAVLFKQEMNIYNNEYYKINEGDYEYGMNDFTYADSNSFSYFFFNCKFLVFELYDYEEYNCTESIYKYHSMNKQYFNTYCEYVNRNQRIL